MNESIQLSLDRLYRKSDPSTSLLAAIKASKASRKAVEAVQSVMADQDGRTDYELWQACREVGFKRSEATIRHARLALSEAGELQATGVTRPTPDEGESREWRKA